ncbi:riboflavin synthase [Desulfotignum phosphitoxidans]|uniref:Riboflavin synthase n=1 Tax=Desulfotignum phosphitoxidans DSM 13687 TaxID=1286635 RepID=S0G3D7_9BACT|nr:riboflavin synthase [Desulfotignum phosphitoxidans]EMS78682.1 riboflavin synthase alpha chain [Desulfotignum phosphitoxidans DSM 13687]
MFTGIIESLGTIHRVIPQGEGKVLQIRCGLDLSDTRIGDSIAVNGACLTAVHLEKHAFSVDMAPETVARTTFKTAAPGMRVNVERAMQLLSRVDGHLVSGHIDGTGVITRIENKSNAILLTIAVDTHLAGQMIEKGSVAVDGISLTINQCTDTDFSISIIPHTAKLTTIGFKQTGDFVNIETDMIGKYVRKFLTRTTASVPETEHTDISMSLLAQNGFL